MVSPTRVHVNPETIRRIKHLVAQPRDTPLHLSFRGSDSSLIRHIDLATPNISFVADVNARHLVGLAPLPHLDGISVVISPEDIKEMAPMFTPGEELTVGTDEVNERSAGEVERRIRKELHHTRKVGHIYHSLKTHHNWEPQKSPEVARIVARHASLRKYECTEEQYLQVMLKEDLIPKEHVSYFRGSRMLATTYDWDHIYTERANLFHFNKKLRKDKAHARLSGKCRRLVHELQRVLANQDNVMLTIRDEAVECMFCLCDTFSLRDLTNVTHLALRSSRSFPTCRLQDRLPPSLRSLDTGTSAFAGIDDETAFPLLEHLTIPGTYQTLRHFDGIEFHKQRGSGVQWFPLVDGSHSHGWRSSVRGLATIKKVTYTYPSKDKAFAFGFTASLLPKGVTTVEFRPLAMSDLVGLRIPDLPPTITELAVRVMVPNVGGAFSSWSRTFHPSEVHAGTMDAFFLRRLEANANTAR